MPHKVRPFHVGASQLAPTHRLEALLLLRRLGFFQVAEEIAAWVQHQYVALVRKAFAVSAQAAIELVELLVLTCLKK